MVFGDVQIKVLSPSRLVSYDFKIYGKIHFWSMKFEVDVHLVSKIS